MPRDEHRDDRQHLGVRGVEAVDRDLDDHAAADHRAVRASAARRCRTSRSRSWSESPSAPSRRSSSRPRSCSSLLEGDKEYAGRRGRDPRREGAGRGAPRGRARRRRGADAAETPIDELEQAVGVGGRRRVRGREARAPPPAAPVEAAWTTPVTTSSTSATRSTGSWRCSGPGSTSSVALFDEARHPLARRRAPGRRGHAPAAELPLPRVRTDHPRRLGRARPARRPARAPRCACSRRRPTAPSPSSSGKAAVTAGAAATVRATEGNPALQ